MVFQPLCRPASAGHTGGAHAPGLGGRNAPSIRAAARGRACAGRAVRALCWLPARLKRAREVSPPAVLFSSRWHRWAEEKEGEHSGGRAKRRGARILPVSLMMHWWNGGHGGVCSPPPVIGVDTRRWGRLLVGHIVSSLSL